MSTKTSVKYHRNMIQQNKSLGSLNSIHTRIVVTPIDKASRNVAFIYKRF